MFDDDRHEIPWNNCDGILVTMKYNDIWPINYNYPIVTIVAKRDLFPFQCMEFIQQLNPRNMLRNEISNHKINGRIDRRNLHTFTIDDGKAKLFDDAISFEYINQS